jgi:hypothetical protein
VYDRVLEHGMTARQIAELEERMCGETRKMGRYYRKFPVVSVSSETELIRIDGKGIRFAMSPETVHKSFGQPELHPTRDYLRSLDQHEEYFYGRSLILRYGELGVKNTRRGSMSLYEAVIMEKGGCQVEVDGISIFADNNLSRMKSKYRCIVSKDKNAIAFPTLGVFVVGCGDGSRDRDDDRGGIVFLCDKDTIRFYISTIIKRE